MKAVPASNAENIFCCFAPETVIIDIMKNFSCKFSGYG